MNIKSSDTKRMLIALSILLVLVISTLFIKNRFFSPKKVVTPTEHKTETEDVKADLNGDGKQDTLRLSINNTTESYSVASLVTYDENGKELGRLPDSMPIAVPMTGTGKVYTPITKDKNQFVSFDFGVGPHSSETMFFGLFSLKAGGMGVLPVCLTENVKGAPDCLFWSGEVGQLAATDLDSDGNLEVIEIIDEYPKDGLITTDIQKNVEDTWKDSGQTAIDGAIRIIKREQGGRGRKVVWGIYHYNGSYFEKQTVANYSKYFVLAKDYLKSIYPDIIRKDQMSQSSLDYNVFMKSFWTGR